MLMVRKIVLSIFTVLAVAAVAIAQNRQVSGTVKDSAGQPVIGAAIVVEGSNVGTTTNVNGAFRIEAASNATLIVSFIGYETQSVAVAGKTNIDIVLADDSQSIDEVVVTGYGVQRKVSFTGAASVIGEELLDNKTDANFVKSLEGSVAGVQMNNSNSMPGAWGEIFVRGQGSLSSGSAPLYVVDGMPVNSDVDGLQTNLYLDPMAAINPADIESVTVLKDAAATSIYGARASNGVIIVTTKKGSEGRVNINVDIKQGVTSMANHNMHFADAFESMDLFSRGFAAYYGTTPEEEYDYLSKVYGWDGVSSYDWMDAVTRNGYYQDYNVNIQGNTGNTGYFASAGYLDSEGIVINSDMTRFTGRLNLDTKFKIVTVGVNSSYSYSIQNGFSQSTGGSMTSPIVGASTQMKPFYPFYNEDGTYNTSSATYNPLAVWDEQVGDISRVWNQTVNINPYVQLDFGKGIYAKSTFGVNVADQREYQYWGAIYNNQGMSYNGLGQQYTTKNTVLTWNNVLGWNYTFGEKHDVSFLVGQEMQAKTRSYDYMNASDFPFASSGMRDLSTVGTWSDSEHYEAEAKLASYFLDAHYSFNDRIYVSGSYRRDGSSVFGSNNRWGNFWSVGAKYRFSEDLFADSEVFTNAAVRASYGTVGNQDIGWYAARGFYESGYNYAGVPGMVPTSIPNPDLTWEVSKKLDVGFDLSLADRVHFTLDYYNELTDNALYSVPLSLTTGLSSAMSNIGAIRNSGWELSVNANIFNRRDFSWNAYANFSWNQNEVVRLNGEPIESTLYIVEEGRPYNQFKMKEWAGVDDETGMPLWYKNETGDETTSDYNEATKRYVGSAEPKMVGGFGTSLNWKGLDFNASFTFRTGGKVYDNGASFTGFGMALRTPHKDLVYDSWTPENKDAKHPEYIYGDPYGSTDDSSRFLYDGDYLKISNIALGYTLPQKWTSKIAIQKLRIYVSADNLYTFRAKNFYGYTSETYSDGMISWQYPATKTFTGGVQITF